MMFFLCNLMFFQEALAGEFKSYVPIKKDLLLKVTSKRPLKRKVIVLCVVLKTRLL